MKITRRMIVAGILPTMLCYSVSALAAEYDALVRVGLGVSDNIARSPTLEVDETIATFGFDFGVTESTRRLDLRIRSNVDYLDYLDDTFDAEWIGGLNGVAIINLIEERLEWEVRNHFGQQVLNPLAPARPGNRENVNFFTTGPTLRLPAGARNSIALDARYSRVDYEERPFDNERLSGGIRLSRATSRDTAVSLNARSERVEFKDEDLNPPIDQFEAFIGFEKSGLRNSLAIELGYNEVEYAGEKGDGVLASIRWTRQTTANGSLSIVASSRYSDQGDIFRLYQEITNDLRETVDGVETPSPFQHDFLSISHVIDTQRHTVNLSVDWSREDFVDGPGLNRELMRAAAWLQREISRNVDAGASIRLSKRDYQDFVRTDDDLVVGANVGYSFSPGLSLTLDYQHFRRESSSVDADVTENRIFLRAEYTPAWSR